MSTLITTSLEKSPRLLGKLVYLMQDGTLEQAKKRASELPEGVTGAIYPTQNNPQLDEWDLAVDLSETNGRLLFKSFNEVPLNDAGNSLENWQCFLAPSNKANVTNWLSTNFNMTDYDLSGATYDSDLFKAELKTLLKKHGASLTVDGEGFHAEFGHNDSVLLAVDSCTITEANL
ncbi:hypothetical protein AB4455_12130 [Vibrio sp. 10N.261.46.E12]|uniref:hypothetical protein n=1 Tax=unclassified Vibrio TaxID=2614977 RepID=UPI0010549BC2|nr:MULTISPECIES: hypothetical protein [unclassified Vibrio]